MTIEKLKPEERFEAIKGVRAFYIRHTQKDMVGTGGRKISIGGVWRAEGLGQLLKSDRTTGQQISWSGVRRTEETAQAINLGKRIGHEKEYRTVKCLSLDYDKGPEFEKIYELWEQRADQEIERVLAARGLDRQDLSNMDNDQREVIENESEEPFIEEWLSNPDSEAAKIYPPQRIVEQLAPQARKDIKIIDHLNKDSFIDLLRISHKGILEPLLMKILILPTGQKAEKLSDIGGSLKMGEGFSIETKVNAGGRKEIKMVVYRLVRGEDGLRHEQQEYGIDLEELDKLADEAIVRSKQKDAQGAAV